MSHKIYGKVRLFQYEMWQTIILSSQGHLYLVICALGCYRYIYFDNVRKFVW